MEPRSPETHRACIDRHLWEFRAVRDLAWILAVLGVIWLAMLLQAVVVPILIAFALAYVVNPIVDLARRRARVPRLATATLLFLLVLAAMVAFAAWMLPKFVTQLTELTQRLPDYYGALAERHGLPPLEEGELMLPTQPATRIDPQQTLRAVLTGTGRLFGFIGDVVGTTTYLVTAGVLTLVLFLYFATRLDRAAALKRYLPAGRRDRIWYLLTQVERAFSGYVRGQLVVALFTTAGFCLGFWLADVPYWFIVSLVGGTLSLIPYGQMAGPILAIVMMYLETQAGGTEFTWTGVLLPPLIVYAVTQSMERWVITPLVQGEATNLHPVTVLIVLILGAALGGILGLILAVPVTASACMLFQEELGPRLRRWVDAH